MKSSTFIPVAALLLQLTYCMQNVSTINFDRVIARKSFYEPGLHMPRHIDSLSKISITIDGSWEEQTDLNHISANSPSLVIKPREAYHETTFGKKGSTILSIQFADETIFPKSFREWNCFTHPGLSLLAMKFWSSLKKVRSDKELQVIFEHFIITAGFLKNQKTVTTSLLHAEQLLAASAENKKSIQAISNEVHLHRVYLSRSFKENYLCAPSVYTRQIRLLKAIGYLSVPTISLAGAAYGAEYSDQSHMNRSVKKELGCTPAQLKKWLQ